MQFKTVKVRQESRVAFVTLNRPEAMNALSPELLQDIKGAMEKLKEEPGIKAVVITGEGRAFCAGADLKYVESFLQDISSFVDYMEKFNATIGIVEDFPLPVIALVNGFAFAGGLELLLACDIAIAAEDARIGDQHQNVGLIGGPVLWQLPSRIGLQKALELCWTGKWLSGKEAESWGIVFRAVPRERLNEELERLLSQLRNKSRPGLIASKKAMKEAMKQSTFADGVKIATLFSLHHMSTAEEAKEGVRAFLEKRQPQFP